MREYYQNNKDKFIKHSHASREEKNKQQRERYHNDPIYREKRKAEVRKTDKNTKREHHLRYEFGISTSIYNDILAEQYGVCAICGAKYSDKKNRRLHVDHDHVTDKVRGLLCSNCNTGLGNFKDNPELLQLAIDYLLKFKSVDE